MLPPKKNKKRDSVKEELFGKKTKDSTGYFLGKAIDVYENSKNKKENGEITNEKDKEKLNFINQDRERQKNKGKPGYDPNGYPIRKNFLENGKYTV